MSGTLYVGMRGPLATFALRFPNFGVDWTLVTRTLSLAVTGLNNFVVPNGSWSWSLLTDPSPRATWIPTGAEFLRPGQCLFTPELLLDGEHYDVLAFVENVLPRRAAD